MTQPLFVLVRPQMGENIGSAARAMWNFGLNRMALVDPRDGWPNPAATALASGAGRVLDSAQITETTAEAIQDATFVYATTARSRDLTKEVLTPADALADASARIERGQKIAILFGPERAGLENDDIARANAIISVPVNPEFPSLNLAECVLLAAYEWRRASETASPAVAAPEAELATQQEVEHLAGHYETALGEAGFFFPAAKAPGMKQTLKDLWSRMSLTSADVQIFHGIMRQMRRQGTALRALDEGREET